MVVGDLNMELHAPRHAEEEDDAAARIRHLHGSGLCPLADYRPTRQGQNTRSVIDHLAAPMGQLAHWSLTPKMGEPPV